MKRFAAGLLIVTFLVVVGVGLRNVYDVLTKVEQGRSLPNVAWLPNAASNVSFARSYNWRYYEFDISEAEFRHWATTWELSEITVPFYVTTFRFLDSQEPPIRIRYDGPRDYLERKGVAIPETLPDYTAEIKNGLCYYHYQEHNHGGVYVAFDRVKQRVYFRSASR